MSDCAYIRYFRPHYELVMLTMQCGPFVISSHNVTRQVAKQRTSGRTKKIQPIVPYRENDMP